MATITVEGVTKSFNGKTAVRDVDLEVADGQFMIIVGPSGCGKTTTLRMLAGFEKPTQGNVRIGGRVMNDVPPKDRDIAMVFQNYALLPHLTVAKNLSFGMRIRREPRKTIEREVAAIAEMLGISPLLDRKPAQLSGGERQRVAIARAVAGERRLLLADEPSGALDSANAEAVMRLIHNACKRGVAAVVVTHDAQLASWADRVVFLRDGRIVDQTAPPPGPESLLSQGQTP